MNDRFNADVMGIKHEWNAEAGTLTLDGIPVTALFRDSTLASLLLGFQTMLGGARFALAQQAEGQRGTGPDWELITSEPTFEAGFEKLAQYAAAVGWGRWKLVSVNRETKELTVTVANSWEGEIQKVLGVNWGSNLVAGKFGDFASRLFGVNCRAEQTRSIANGDPVDEFVAKPSDREIGREVAVMARSEAATRAELEVALHELRTLSTEREKALEERVSTANALQEQLAVIERQRQDILSLSAPILQIWESVIAVPVIGAFSRDRAGEMTERVFNTVIAERTRFVILDLTGVDMVDTETADSIVRIVSGVQLMGARGLLAGIQPKVAQTIVAMGVSLDAIASFATLRDALRRCIAELSAR